MCHWQHQVGDLFFEPLVLLAQFRHLIARRFVGCITFQSFLTGFHELFVPLVKLV